MKWLALSTVLAVGLFLVAWLRENPKSIPKVLVLMGFLPFALAPFHLYMAGISWPDWPGYVKGAEFSVLDALALALYVSLPAPRHPLPFRFSILLYIAAASLSILQAGVWMAASFYIWQLARVFLVYAAVARACACPGYPTALLKGMAAGLILQAGVAMWERFGLGILQAAGTAGHQNLLGLTTHFAAFPFFALLLASHRGWVARCGMLASVLIQALTTSRATVGLALFGYVAVFGLASLRRWTTQSTVVMLVGVVVAGVLTPFVMASFERRFTVQGVIAIEGVQDYDERAAFQKAASMMIADHPWGVGANHYVISANVDGYNNLAGVAPVSGSLSTNVHNVYMLVTAETGYLGLVTFVLLLLCPMIVAFRCGFRHRGDERGEMLIGLGVALLAVYLHSFFEWIFIGFQAQYLWAFDVGMIAGLAQQLGYWGSEQKALRPVFQGFRSRVDGVPTYHGRTPSNPALTGSTWRSPVRKLSAGAPSLLSRRLTGQRDHTK